MGVDVFECCQEVVKWLTMPQDAIYARGAEQSVHLCSDVSAYSF